MIDVNNITRDEEIFYYYISLYIRMYVDYVITIRDVQYDKDQSLRKKPFRELFEKYVFSHYKEYFGARNPKKVFKSMIYVFDLISGFYMLSLANDEMLKKVGDDYLKGISDTLNASFVDKSYCNQFDDRQKIEYIRNAISHPEKGRLYKALLNGTIEVKLDRAKAKDKSEKPFHINISCYDIHEIVHYLINGGYEYFIPSADVIKKNLFYMSDSGIKRVLQNAHYYKAYTRFNTDEEIVKKIELAFHTHPDKYTETEQLKDLRSLVENGIVDGKTFKYDDKQIDAFISCINRIRNLGFRESEDIDPFDFVMRISNYSIYPHPAIRMEEMRMLRNYTINELSNLNNSMEKANQKFIENSQIDPQAYITNNDIFLMFPEFQVMTAIALYYYYIFVHMRPRQRDLNINGTIYDVERIRNSFTHGTFFSYYDEKGSSNFYEDFKYALYDCKDGQKNEGKWTWESPVMSHSELLEISSFVSNLKVDEYKKSKR